MRIVFPYIAQRHQIPHSLPIAIEIAQRHRDCEVHLAVPGETLLPFIRRLIADYAPDAPLQIDSLRLDPISRFRCSRGRTPWKQMLLQANRKYFQGFDAIVTPERTSLYLRRIGVSTPRLIWTRHGAGDREVGFSRDVHQFDFVLMAGRRIERRLLAMNLIRPGAYLTGVYAKFDWLRSAEPQSSAHWFDNGRPTVLYNPHFAPRLSSWPRFGLQVLEQFAASERYNLIFAPHVRLFDPVSASDYKAFANFQGLPHLHIDLGSERSVDMSYTRAADCYLGDVSSQVAEFLFKPRPCLFLDAHGQHNWQNDPNYAFWKLGPVTRSAAGLETQLDHAFARHADFAPRQRRYFQDSFELPPGQCSAARGADGIVAFLRQPRAMAKGVASPPTALPQGG